MLQLGRLVMRIMSADFDPLPAHYSDGLSDVIKRMLALNPDDRPSVSELLQVPIVREAREGLPSAGLRSSVDLTSHHVGDGTPLSHDGVSPTQALEPVALAAVNTQRHNHRLVIDASIVSGHVVKSCAETVSPITPVGSEGGPSSLTSPQPPESAVKAAVAAVPTASSSDLSLPHHQHVSENYVDDFEPEPDDAWEAQLPRSRATSSEADHIQEEEGALRTDSAALVDFIEDECSDSSYEDDFDVEQDVAVPAVKLNGSICSIPLFDASSDGVAAVERAAAGHAASFVCP
jgi:serine/threonine protein kinase